MRKAENDYGTGSVSPTEEIGTTTMRDADPSLNDAVNTLVQRKVRQGLATDIEVRGNRRDVVAEVNRRLDELSVSHALSTEIRDTLQAYMVDASNDFQGRSGQFYCRFVVTDQRPELPETTAFQCAFFDGETEQRYTPPNLNQMSYTIHGTRVSASQAPDLNQMFPLVQGSGLMVVFASVKNDDDLNGNDMGLAVGPLAAVEGAAAAPDVEAPVDGAGLPQAEKVAEGPIELATNGEVVRESMPHDAALPTTGEPQADVADVHSDRPIADLPLNVQAIISAVAEDNIAPAAPIENSAPRVEASIADSLIASPVIADDLIALPVVALNEALTPDIVSIANSPASTRPEMPSETLEPITAMAVDPIEQLKSSTPGFVMDVVAGADALPANVVPIDAGVVVKATELGAKGEAVPTMPEKAGLEKITETPEAVISNPGSPTPLSTIATDQPAPDPMIGSVVSTMHTDAPKASVEPDALTAAAQVGATADAVEKLGEPAHLTPSPVAATPEMQAAPASVTGSVSTVETPSHNVPSDYRETSDIRISATVTKTEIASDLQTLSVGDRDKTAIVRQGNTSSPIHTVSVQGADIPTDVAIAPDVRAPDGRKTSSTDFSPAQVAVAPPAVIAGEAVAGNSPVPRTEPAQARHSLPTEVGPSPSPQHALEPKASPTVEPLRQPVDQNDKLPSPRPAVPTDLRDDRVAILPAQEKQIASGYDRAAQPTDKISSAGVAPMKDRQDSGGGAGGVVIDAKDRFNREARGYEAGSDLKGPGSENLAVGKAPLDPVANENEPTRDVVHLPSHSSSASNVTDGANNRVVQPSDDTVDNPIKPQPNHREDPDRIDDVVDVKETSCDGACETCVYRSICAAFNAAASGDETSSLRLKTSNEAARQSLRRSRTQALTPLAA